MSVIASFRNTVNSRLAGTPLLRTLAITDKIQVPIYRGLTENGSRYYGLSLFRTQNDVPKASTITRVDCSGVSARRELTATRVFQTNCLQIALRPHCVPMSVFVFSLAHLSLKQESGDLIKRISVSIQFRYFLTNRAMDILQRILLTYEICDACIERMFGMFNSCFELLLTWG